MQSLRMRRLLRRCSSENTQSPLLNVLKKHSGIPDDKHKAIELAYEVCKKYRQPNVSDAFANDGGHFWRGGASSVILALLWCLKEAEQNENNPAPFLLSAVIDAGWRSNGWPYSDTSEQWYEDAEKGWNKEFFMLNCEMKV